MLHHQDEPLIRIAALLHVGHIEVVKSVIISRGTERRGDDNGSRLFEATHDALVVPIRLSSTVLKRLRYLCISGGGRHDILVKPGPPEPYSHVLRYRSARSPLHYTDVSDHAHNRDTRQLADSEIGECRVKLIVELRSLRGADRNASVP